MPIKNIANLAGVSVATVSRVINNDGCVKSKNREKVLDAIERLDYKPNLQARNLRTSRSPLILVLISDISNPFCAELVKGIETKAYKNGFHILLCNTHSELKQAIPIVNQLSGNVVAGIITLGSYSTLPEVAELIGNIPWVQCAETDEVNEISYVGINDIEASRQLVAHLSDIGRGRIALINHDLNYKYARLRQQGYLQELECRKISWQCISFSHELSYEAGKRVMTRLLDGTVFPDAVFAVSDVLAIGAMSAIESAGMSVPEDIAVVGFDGTYLAEMVSPQLTTITQPGQKIGENAFDLLHKKIDDPESPAIHLELEWQLSIRASSVTS